MTPKGVCSALQRYLCPGLTSLFVPCLFPFTLQFIEHIAYLGLAPCDIPAMAWYRSGDWGPYLAINSLLVWLLEAQLNLLKYPLAIGSVVWVFSLDRLIFGVSRQCSYIYWGLPVI